LYDPPTGTWMNTGTMNARRFGHTATLLGNGKVLVAGGWDQFSLAPTNDAELYDPSTGNWSKTGSLNVGRYIHTATLLPDGQVLVAGGEATNFEDTIITELYNPMSGTWSTTSPLGRDFEQHTATLLPNGDVLLAGGFLGQFGGSSFVETYNPATGLWIFTNNFPQAYGQTAVLLPDGQVLASGGVPGTSTPTNREVLYDEGLGFSAAWQPQIAAAPTVMNQGTSLTLAGSRFRGVSEASGGNCGQNSSSDHPVVQLRALESGQTLMLSCTNWSTNSFVSAPVMTNFPAGWAMVTMYANGIYSTSSIVLVAPSAAGAVVLTHPKALPGGAFQFVFTNTPGAIFTALATTNLSLPSNHWTAVGGATEIADGQFQFTDTGATNYPRRFYRIESP
jgi:Kelch motif